MIGKEIGSYRILKELGKGGMGVVYKANQLSLARMVAMKVLPQHLTDDPPFIKRFQNEARAIAKLNHPNIVQIYDIGHEDNVHYYTMEFIEGASLDEIIYREGFLPLDRAINIVVDVAKALQYAHGQGIVHRDIKPSNIMIDRSGRVKVTDFGLALQQRTTRLTVEGSIVGTPEYMSPEQAMGQTATARSDIYSLGVVFYELLTGKVPFEGDGPLVVLNKMQTSEPQWPRSINPQIPVEVEKAIRNMMAKKPPDRYVSCQELIQDLQQLKVGQPISGKTRRTVNFQFSFARTVRVLIPPLIFAALIFFLWPTPLPLGPYPPKELYEMNRELVLLQWQLKNIRHQCRPESRSTVDQTLEELPPLWEQSHDNVRQYMRGDVAAPDQLDGMMATVAGLRDGLAPLRQACEPDLKDKLQEMNAELALLEKQLVHIWQQCRDSAVPVLKNEFGNIESRIALLLGNTRSLYEQDEPDNIATLKDWLHRTRRRLSPLERRLEETQQDYGWVDVLLLKTGSTMKCAITGESLEKISFRAAGTSEGVADIMRRKIKLIVYASDIQNQIAEILNSEVPRVKGQIKALREEMSMFEERLETEQPPDENGTLAEIATEKKLAEEGLLEADGSPERTSIQIPLLAENWRTAHTCDKGMTLSFDENTISISTNDQVGESDCTVTVSTANPVAGIPHFIELRAQVQRTLPAKDDRASSSLAIIFADGKSLEYFFFDSQADQIDVEELSTAKGLRIKRSKMLIVPSESWHELKMPVAEDAAKIGASKKEIAAIKLVHRHAGPTKGVFTSRYGQITVHVM